MSLHMHTMREGGEHSETLAGNKQGCKSSPRTEFAQTLGFEVFTVSS